MSRKSGDRLSESETRQPMSARRITDQVSARALDGGLIVIFVGLALAPFIFPGSQPLNVAAKICYFIVLAASYDLLLGYTGIVSFAHTMFFGIGGYGAGIALYSLGPSWSSIAIGTLLGLMLSI